MKEISNEKELEEVLTQKLNDENSKCVFIIGAPWCPNCQMMIGWTKKPEFDSKLPEGTEIFVYETNQDDVGNDNSFIRSGISKLTGTEVFSLPSIFYIKGKTVVNGGFTTEDSFIQKIEENLK